MDLSKIANIGNLSLVQVAMNTLTNRAEGLPGLGVLYGASGYGKTTATIVFANKTQANYMRLSSVLSKKTFLEKIAFEIGANPSTKNTSGYFDAICEQLAITNRPLILDEADYLVSKTGMVELVRDIYESSQTPILLVGEEQMPNKLKKYERFHGRVLSWIPALPVSMEDAQVLAKVYAPKLRIDDDVLHHIVAIAHGSVRRVVVNLVNLDEKAEVYGYDYANMESVKKMKDFQFY